MIRAFVALAMTGALLAGCAAASPTPAPAAAPAAAAIEVRLVARDITFVPLAVGVPPGVPVHLVLDNQDDGVPHDIALLGIDGRTKLAATEIVIGPASTELDVPGLVPGAYQLWCEVHPMMVSRLAVGG